jgi:hypothetical protein
MLSEELRNIALWMLTRSMYRAHAGVPTDPDGTTLAANVLTECAEQAERLERGMRLRGEEIAERIALEGFRR